MVINGLSGVVAVADGGTGGGSHCQTFDVDVTPFDDAEAEVCKLGG